MPGMWQILQHRVVCEHRADLLSDPPPAEFHLRFPIGGAYLDKRSPALTRGGGLGGA